MSTPHDFDFLLGTWRVRNRRLRERLVGCDEWIAFDGLTIERPLWGGIANVEEYLAALPDGTSLRGMALRLFDTRERRWSIHWSSASLGTLDPPLHGTFANGVGEFHGRDTHEGRPVAVRFLWTHDGHDAARWEQAFSVDDGATWETNWIMEFTRVV
jgi:hypothetical protein